MALAVQQLGTARDELYSYYASKLVVNRDLDRTLVSFQANRKTPFYAWFKYREGFSTALITYILAKLEQKPGVLLDPFVGAGSALFASASRGWESVGIEVLPVGIYAMQARVASEKVEPSSFADTARSILAEDLASYADEQHTFKHIPITAGAFPDETEREMSGYLARAETITGDPNVKALLHFACFCVLEEISFTRKDGQYLRWDYRSGRTRGTKQFDKGSILSFRDAITGKLDQISRDLLGTPDTGQARLLPLDTEQPTVPIGDRASCIDGSCLAVLPSYPAQSVDLVITSPLMNDNYPLPVARIRPAASCSRCPAPTMTSEGGRHEDRQGGPYHDSRTRQRKDPGAGRRTGRDERAHRAHL